MSPHFVCLSMIVSRRAWDESPYLAAVDCLAYAIERENDPEPLPPLVQKGVAIFEGARSNVTGPGPAAEALGQDGKKES